MKDRSIQQLCTGIDSATIEAMKLQEFQAESKPFCPVQDNESMLGSGDFI